MIRQLAKVELQWGSITRFLLILLPLFLVAASAMHSTQALLLMQASMVFPLVGSVAMTMQRSTHAFFAGMPVPVRSLYLARTLILLALIGALLSVVVLLDVLFRHNISPAQVQNAVGFLLVAVLPVLAFQVWCLRHPDYSGRALTMIWALEMAVMFWAAIRLSFLRPDKPFLLDGGALTLGASLMAFVIVFVGYRVAPKSYAANPRTQTRSASEPRHRIPALALMPLVRSCYTLPYAIWIPILFIQGMAQSGYLSCFMGGVCISMAHRGINWLQPLPVSRRTILAALLLPATLSLMAGHAVHNQIYSKKPDTPIQVTHAPCGKPDFTVPLNLWKTAPDGTAPTITAPWGESHRPPMVPFGSFQIYNPYAVSCEYSQQYITWQFRRAYDATIHHGDFRERAIDYAMFCAVIFAAALLVLLPTWRGFTRMPPWVRWMAIATSIALYVPMVFPALGLSQRWRFLENRTAWLGFALPANSVAVLVIPVALLYLAVQELALRCEFAPKVSPEALWRAQWQ